MRHMNAKFLTISVLIACCILAAPVQATIVAQKPVFSSTDHWTYGEVGVTTDTTTMSVTSMSDTKNSYTCYKVAIAISTNGTSTTVSSWYRTSDMALVASESSISSGGYSVTSSVTFDPPASAYKFPMKVGDTWTVHQTVRSVSQVPYFGKVYSNSTQDITYVIVGEETVTVTAGTFDTLKITATYTSTNVTTFWYAPKAGSYAKVETKDKDGTSTSELKEYSFKNAPSGGGGGGNGDGGGLGGMMLYIVIVVIVIVVVVVLVVIMMKKKPAPAQQPMVQPVLPGQPGAPTTQAPPLQPPAQPPQYQPQPAAAPAYDPAQYQQPPAQQYQQQPQYPQQPPQG